MDDTREGSERNKNNKIKNKIYQKKTHKKAKRDRAQAKIRVNHGR